MKELTKIVLRELGLKEGERFTFEGFSTWSYMIKDDSLHFLNYYKESYGQVSMISSEIDYMLRDKSKIKKCEGETV